MGTKKLIRWTEQEWDTLAETVVAMRHNSFDSLMMLAKRAQQQLPKDRQRSQASMQQGLGPLQERVLQKEAEIRSKASSVSQLESKVRTYEKSVLSPEEVLETMTEKEIADKFYSGFRDSLTPEEVLAVFSAEVLLASISTGDLAAVVARRLVETMAQPVNVRVSMPEQKPSANGNTAPSKKRKRVAVIGVKGDIGIQIRQRVGHVCDLTYQEVDKLRAENVPASADHIVILSKFVSHKHRRMVFQVADPRKIVEHFTGTTELANKIEDLCAT